MDSRRKPLRSHQAGAALNIASSPPVTAERQRRAGEQVSLSPPGVFQIRKSARPETGQRQGPRYQAKLGGTAGRIKASLDFYAHRDRQEHRWNCSNNCQHGLSLGILAEPAEPAAGVRCPRIEG
jgi:hypothetical protein